MEIVGAGGGYFILIFSGELHIRVERSRDQSTGDYYEKIEGMTFNDSFLYKNVSLTLLDTQNVQPKFDVLEKKLVVSEKELCKYFEFENHVKIVSGATEGATGMVVSEIKAITRLF
ncbi:hypothetical protein CASFOL_027863 [Castilleja foliolosa]|uniref:Spt5 KOW domain-containing protein n=1 Tax=Castilleja foliolosa TaxID=1961234 RepID=A0ABD3CJM2_9LAMI